MPILPNTLAAPWYAFTISVNGIAIGMLQGFNPSQDREVERVRQIMYETGPAALEVVPGATNVTVECERIEMYQANFMQAIGRNLVSLDDLVDPFDILEEKHTPTGTIYRVQYVSCVVQRYGRRIVNTGTFVLESVTMQCARVRPG